MEKSKEDKIGLEIKYQIGGWILFIICAIFFVASSLKNQDTLTFIGSIIFLVACIIFLIPLAKSKKTEKLCKNLDEKKTSSNYFSRRNAVLNDVVYLMCLLYESRHCQCDIAVLQKGRAG
jgi:hypothetical protein